MITYFLRLSTRLDLVVDGGQSVVNDLAAHVAFDDGDGGFRCASWVNVSGGVCGPATCARSAVKPPTPAITLKKLLRKTSFGRLQLISRLTGLIIAVLPLKSVRTFMRRCRQ